MWISRQVWIGAVRTVRISVCMHRRAPRRCGRYYCGRRIRPSTRMDVYSSAAVYYALVLGAAPIKPWTPASSCYRRSRRGFSRVCDRCGVDVICFASQDKMGSELPGMVCAPLDMQTLRPWAVGHRLRPILWPQFSLRSSSAGSLNEIQESLEMTPNITPFRNNAAPAGAHDFIPPLGTTNPAKPSSAVHRVLYDSTPRAVAILSRLRPSPISKTDPRFLSPACRQQMRSMRSCL